MESRNIRVRGKEEAQEVFDSYFKGSEAFKNKVQELASEIITFVPISESALRNKKDSDIAAIFWQEMLKYGNKS